jgi:hypothetical protein
MMMDLTSSIIDGLLVFLGVVAGLMAGIGTIISDTSTMSTAPELKAATRSSHQTRSLPKAA